MGDYKACFRCCVQPIELTMYYCKVQLGVNWTLCDFVWVKFINSNISYSKTFILDLRTKDLTIFCLYRLTVKLWKKESICSKCFAESARFQVTNDGTSDAETKQKNGDHFSMPISPQNCRLHVCFLCFPPLGGFSANFEVWLILGCFPSRTAKN